MLHVCYSKCRVECRNSVALHTEDQANVLVSNAEIEIRSCVNRDQKVSGLGPAAREVTLVKQSFTSTSDIFCPPLPGPYTTYYISSTAAEVTMTWLTARANKSENRL